MGRPFKKATKLLHPLLREQLAWAAGFFDGEGSVHVAHHNYPQVSVGQSGERGGDILKRFDVSTGGLGILYGPFPPAKNQTQMRWVYEANGFEKTQALGAMLWEFLSPVKREKFTQTLSRALGGCLSLT